MASNNTNKVFRGDGDAMVQALVDACLPTNRPSLEAPSQPHLIGRTLTPYFGSSEPLPEALDTKPSAGNKRKGSPPNLTRARASSPNEVRLGVHSNIPSSTTPNNSGKIQRSAKSPEHGAIATPAKAVGTHTVMRSKNPSRASLDAAIATATYACPGMFSSPKPETLPMPTSRLLLRAVAA